MKLTLSFYPRTIYNQSPQLENCAGVQEADLEAPKAVTDKVASMPFADLHGEGISDIKFFVALRKCLRTCGVYDFSWKDLHAPTAKRLRWQLSAFINLAKFREDQLPIYSELNEPVSYIMLDLCACVFYICFTNLTFLSIRNGP